MRAVSPVQGWLPVGHPPPGTLREVRQQLHWGVQVVAAAGNSLLDPAADHSHTSLQWVDELQVLSGEVIEGDAPCRAALHPTDLTLQVLGEGGEASSSVALEGLTLEQALAWMASALERHTGRPLERGITRPNHELPDHELSHGGRFLPGNPAALQELSRWFANADRALPLVRTLVPGASPLRCWPHHLDIALLASLDPELGPEEARSVGVGLSPGDGSYDEPYWYVVPWPSPGAEGLPALEAGGCWHREGWTGAVLTATSLLASGGPAVQAERTAAFLDSAVRACLGLLRVES